MWNAGDRARYLRDRADNLRGRLLRLMGRAEETAPDFPSVDEALNAHLRRLWIVQRRAHQRYRPAHVEPSALLLMRSEAPVRWPATRTEDPLHGWQPFVRGPICLVTIPGDHISLFAPENQPKIAEVVAEHVDRYAIRPARARMASAVRPRHRPMDTGRLEAAEDPSCD
jgi:thioesterase domain-containing protein